MLDDDGASTGGARARALVSPRVGGALLGLWPDRLDAHVRRGEASGWSNVRLRCGGGGRR
jgi:hypothetical protein